MHNSKLTDSSDIERIQNELLAAYESTRKRIFQKIFGAALGSIPWVGGFLSAMADFKADEGQIKKNTLYEEWLIEHAEKMKELATTLLDIINRLDQFSEEINERLESEEYLQLIRKAFRTWDNADTFEKKDLIRKLLSNAGAHNYITDDIIRLFLEWLNLYHEIHFAVIKSIFKTPGISRYGIWKDLNGKSVREDSMEADLFKMLVRDLTMGGVIRQHRETDYYGNFVKRTRPKTTSNSSTLKSAFDDEEGYVLTELGKQFVHYTMNEVVVKIG